MISNILMAGIEQAANIMVVDSLFRDELKKDIGKKVSIVFLETVILSILNIYQLNGLFYLFL